MDISGFRLSSEKTMEFSDNIEGNESEYDIDALGIQFPIEYKAKLYKVEDVIELSLYVKYSIETNCSRCLAPMIDYIESESDFRIVPPYYENNEEELNEVEILFIENEEFKIQNLVMSVVITSIPYKSICKEDCKGLCPSCGQDLNVKECNCKQETTDPRLEALLGLFNEDEEV